MFRNVILLIMALVLLSSCSWTGKSNNGILGKVPGIRHNYNADLCDQERADVCKQWPLMEQGFQEIKIYLALEIYSGGMTKKEAMAKIDKAVAIIMEPGVSIGWMMKEMFDNKKDVALGMALADAAGFSIDYAFNAEYMLDDESKVLLANRLMELKRWVDRYTV